MSKTECVYFFNFKKTYFHMDFTAILVKKIVVYLGSFSFVCDSSYCAFSKRTKYSMDK